MWEGFGSSFWKHLGVSSPQWAPEHHPVSCTEGQSAAKCFFPWINTPCHGLTTALTLSCPKKEQENSMERGVWSSSALPGAVGPSPEQGAPWKGQERFCGTMLGSLLSPMECSAIPAVLWLLLWLMRHPHFPIFPALWKEQMAGDVSPSRSQPAVGWVCWRETGDGSLGEAGEGWRDGGMEGWRGSREG